jgi:hypothetical protein
MGLHDPFGYLKLNLWLKERPGVKLSIWFPITKNQESLDFFSWRWRATYCWKALDKSYNFALHIISIEGLQKKLWTSKVARVPIFRILGLQLGSPGTKWHLGVGTMTRHKKYYKGEGGGFSQVRAIVSLMSLVNLCLPVARPCTKMVQLRTNQFVWFLQVHASNCLAYHSS